MQVLLLRSRQGQVTGVRSGTLRQDRRHSSGRGGGRRGRFRERGCRRDAGAVVVEDRRGFIPAFPCTRSHSALVHSSRRTDKRIDRHESLLLHVVTTSTRVLSSPRKNTYTLLRVPSLSLSFFLTLTLSLFRSLFLVLTLTLFPSRVLLGSRTSSPFLTHSLIYSLTHTFSLSLPLAPSYLVRLSTTFAHV